MAVINPDSTLFVATPESVIRKGAAAAAQTILAGDLVAWESDTESAYVRAGAASINASKRRSLGFALNSARPGQTFNLVHGGKVDMGADLLVPGTDYYVNSGGSFGLWADLTAGMSVCLIGIAKSPRILLISIQFPGVTL